jgi:CheY-like chemotaxis protein/HPt (histidine-containing phosphotransfer) domain-containing protein
MKRILIIEDDRFIADVYQAKLRAEGFLVDTASNGRSGLKQFDLNQPNLVLVDLMLPEINGVEVIRSMRARAGNRELPILVFSNAYLGGMVQQAWEAGASQVLTKANCRPGQVVQAVNDALHISSSVPPPPVGATADRQTENGAEFLPEISEVFFRNFPQMLAILHQPMSVLGKTPHDASALQTLCRTVHSIAANAGLAGIDPLAQMATALESLLTLLWEKPERVTPSTLRSIGQAIKLFEDIGVAPHDHALKDPSTARVLVVDDNDFVQHAVRSALASVNVTAICADNAARALEELEQGRFDLIISDIEMPTADGYALCTILRGVPTYEQIPIIFLSQHADPEHRRESFVRGGNDFISKPFLYMELAVKVLSIVMRGAWDDSEQMPPLGSQGRPRQPAEINCQTV